VEGKLTLHGETRPVSVEVRESEGRYMGTARLKQSDFGIKPVKVAGGTVRVKDEVKIEFAIQLAR
jgi:polyisoprenoid-binding protein YceI